MDRQFHELERRALSQPDNLGALRQLVRASERVGWTFKDRRLQEWLKRLTAARSHYLSFDPIYLELRTIDARFVPGLIDLLKRERELGGADSGPWAAALSVLSLMGGRAQCAQSVVLEYFESESELQWRFARWALARICRDKLSLMERYLESETRLQRRAISLFEHLGVHGREYLPLLQEFGKVGGGQLKDEAARAAMNILGPVTPPLVIPTFGTERAASWLADEAYWQIRFCVIAGFEYHRPQKPLLLAPTLPVEYGAVHSNLDKINPWALILRGTKVNVSFQAEGERPDQEQVSAVLESESEYGFTLKGINYKAALVMDNHGIPLSSKDFIFDSETPGQASFDLSPGMHAEAPVYVLESPHF